MWADALHIYRGHKSIYTDLVSVLVSYAAFTKLK